MRKTSMQKRIEALVTNSRGYSPRIYENDYRETEIGLQLGLGYMDFRDGQTEGFIEAATKTKYLAERMEKSQVPLETIDSPEEFTNALKLIPDSVNVVENPNAFPVEMFDHSQQRLIERRFTHIDRINPDLVLDENQTCLPFEIMYMKPLL